MDKFFQPPQEVTLCESEGMEFFGEALAQDVAEFLNSLNKEIQAYQEGVFAQIRPILEAYLADYWLEMLISLNDSEDVQECVESFSEEGQTVFSYAKSVEEIFACIEGEIDGIESYKALDAVMSHFLEKHQTLIKERLKDQLSLLTLGALDQHFMHTDAYKSIMKNALVLSEKLFKHCQEQDTFEKVKGLISPAPAQLHGMQAVLLKMLDCDFAYKVNYKNIASYGFDNLTKKEKEIPGAYSVYSKEGLQKLFRTPDISEDESHILQGYNGEFLKRLGDDTKPIMPIRITKNSARISLYDPKFFAPEAIRSALFDADKYTFVMVDFSNGEENQILPRFHTEEMEKEQFSCDTIMNNGFTCKVNGLTGEISCADSHLSSMKQQFEDIGKPHLYERFRFDLLSALYSAQLGSVVDYERLHADIAYDILPETALKLLTKKDLLSGGNIEYCLDIPEHFLPPDSQERLETVKVQAKSYIPSEPQKKKKRRTHSKRERKKKRGEQEQKDNPSACVAVPVQVVRKLIYPAVVRDSTVKEVVNHLKDIGISMTLKRFNGTHYRYNVTFSDGRTRQVGLVVDRYDKRNWGILTRTNLNYLLQDLSVGH